MNFVFLHPEFFFWMVPPIIVLFYFWQTQKPYETRWIGENVLNKLRAPKTTMGLKERNLLFLLASLLLIGAMAQPVIIDTETPFHPKAQVAVAINIGENDEKTFETLKELAAEVIRRLDGEEIAIVAFDKRLYRVAPMSQENGMLAYLAEHLTLGEGQSDQKVMIQQVQTRLKSDLLVVVSNLPCGQNGENMVYLCEQDNIDTALGKIEQIKESKRLKNHLPLFFYPLGLAMVLIWIALSSMSRRISVSIVFAAVMITTGESPSSAGLLDFRLLDNAVQAYENGEYRKSAELFGEYQHLHDSPQVRYNRANALYMSGHYQEAVYWYGQVFTNDVVLKERTRSNLAKALEKNRAVSNPSRSSLTVKRENIGKEWTKGHSDESFQTPLYLLN